MRRDHMDPELARALEDDFAARVPRDARRAVGVLALPWQAVIAVAVAALVIGASIAALLVAVPRSQPANGSDPAPSIAVKGKTLVRVGTFPWADAVWQDSAHTRLTVYADVDRIHKLPGAFACNTVYGRARVRWAASTATVVLDAYQAPPPDVPNLGCGGVGHSPIAMTVRLGRPLDGRALVDGTTGTRHAVLDPTTVPTPTALPTGFVLRSTTWDERNDFATRLWATDTSKKGSYEDYTVTVFTKGPLSGEYGKSAGTISIHGRKAVVFVSSDSYDWTAHVQWTTASGTLLELASHGNLRNHRPLAEIERVAQSIPAV